MGAKVSEYFEQDIFRINNKLFKMDMISVPFFKLGAMENWGMNAYNLQSGTFSEENKSADTMAMLDKTISHECECQGRLSLNLSEGFVYFPVS